MIGVFKIVDCCGVYIKVVEIPVDIGSAWRDEDGWIDDFTLCLDYRSDALIVGGCSHCRCDTCGDTAYRVRFSHFIDDNGQQVELADA